MPRLIRFSRIATAVTLIIISIWALYLPPLFPSSTRALLNATTYEVNAPIAGVVSDDNVAEKQLVKAGTTVAKIRRNQEQIRQEIDQDKVFLQKTKTNYEAVVAALTKQLNKFDGAKQDKLVFLTADYREAQKEVALLEAEISLRSEDKDQIAELYQEGIITQAQFQKTKLAAISTERELLAARRKVLSLKTELASLNDQNSTGADIGSGFQLTDSALMAQEIRSLEMQSVTLQAEMVATEQKMQNALQFVEDGQAYPVFSPATGLIWKKRILAGQTVEQGDVLFEVANVESMFVEAYISRQFLDSIEIGDKASVYLNNDKRFLTGRVREIQSQEQGSVAGFAVPSISPSPLSLKLIIGLDRDQVDVGQLGHLAKVIITSANPSFAEKIMVWLSVNLRANY
ncbi:HlyD family secretion protein [Arenicella xantha]|uniref:Multidrug resistance efflux pump n=1 Tax=Arenicella xantha TaxID=644221 RepID=A0A395JNP8_9GAMM|nr:HlyD family secretion protein [Arenicella xantha]RBP51184.1 multidrug resistance efflux pump [Arenicella xantha]